MRNNGTQINYIDANNVLFDGLKPPDTFLDLKSELIFGSFVSVKAHIDLTHSQKKSRNVGSSTPEKCLNTEFSGLYVLVFGQNTKIYSVNLHIKSRWGEIRTRKTPYLDFSRSENQGKFSFKHIYSIHPEKMPLQFEKNEFFTSKLK